jgi:hypothetical protein
MEAFALKSTNTRTYKKFPNETSHSADHVNHTTTSKVDEADAKEEPTTPYPMGNNRVNESGNEESIGHVRQELSPLSYAARYNSSGCRRKCELENPKVVAILIFGQSEFGRSNKPTDQLA